MKKIILLTLLLVVNLSFFVVKEVTATTLVTSIYSETYSVDNWNYYYLTDHNLIVDGIFTGVFDPTHKYYKADYVNDNVITNNIDEIEVGTPLVIVYDLTNFYGAGYEKSLTYVFNYLMAIDGNDFYWSRIVYDPAGLYENTFYIENSTGYPLNVYYDIINLDIEINDIIYISYYSYKNIGSVNGIESSIGFNSFYTTAKKANEFMLELGSVLYGNILSWPTWEIYYDNVQVINISQEFGRGFEPTIFVFEDRITYSNCGVIFAYCSVGTRPVPPPPPPSYILSGDIIAVAIWSTFTLFIMYIFIRYLVRKKD